ncbi:MAG: hypothetical protein H6831_07170 [Planctomycetes bacterium]|nr:hypothetical protein [Planctomycetota bacterium]
MTLTDDTRVRPALREPLRRALNWMLSLRDAGGAIVCPDHGVEHSGKSAGAIVLALELMRAGEPDRETLKAGAVEQGRRLVGNLINEPNSPCYTFRPGRHDPFNCSNSVIDGGACSDALSELVQVLGPELDSADREAFRHASLLHARTYLRYAILDKGIPAQRAWGLTGLANAQVLESDELLERAALEAVGILEGIQHGDGSYPYHPLEWGAAHPGAGDVSSFYQSRVTAFLLFALERLGRDPTDPIFRTPLMRGLDFLLGLQGPDGVKIGLVEAKPWYWGAEYEVASHPFDVAALCFGHEHFRRAELATAARHSFEAWARHLSPSGRPTSHKPGPGRGDSYQCPLFWAAHASWAARALSQLELAYRAPEAPPKLGSGIDIAVRAYEDAQLVRLEDDAVVAWVRGARPAWNLHHGSPHGAGLLQVVRKADGRALLERRRHAAAQEAEWSCRAGKRDWKRGWRAGADELRFSFWLSRVHARAGRVGQALAAPSTIWRHGVAGFASPVGSSSFASRAAIELLPDGVVVRAPLGFRGGEAIEGSEVERRYRIDGEGLEVRERLIGEGAARDVSYHRPSAAREVADSGSGLSYRLG